MRGTDFEKRMKLFYAIVPCVLFAWAGVALWREHAARAAVLASIGAVLLALRYLLPSAAAALFRAQAALLGRIGSFLTKAFMTIFFYVIFCPYGALMRLFGGDLLHRRPDPKLKTYWLPKKEKPNCETPY